MVEHLPMSLNGSFLSEDQFMCSICLDVFTNPSSTPCGHSFCMTCISRYWDGSQVYQCPLCKKTFQKRPDLQINRTLREITDQFKSMNDGVVLGKNKKGRKAGRGAFIQEFKKKFPKSSSKENTQDLGDSILPLLSPVTAPMASSVPDTAVVGSPNTSLHPPSLYPRSLSNGRRRFTLSGAASSQHIPLCETHLRGLMLYCRSDQMCICPECEIEDHNDHDTVSVETEWMETKTQLRNSEEEIQEMIRVRTKKIDEIKTSVTEVEMAVERETSGSVRLYSTLVSAIERSQAELMEVMEISRRAARNHADAMIRQLEWEIEDLKQRESALAELAQSDDHIHCVKTFPDLSTPPVTKDWSGVSLNSDLGTATVYRSLSAMMEKFQEDLKDVVENGFPATGLGNNPVLSQSRAKKIQEYALDVTLDTNTAHPRLVLSEDLKTVWCVDRHHHVPESPERFDRVVCVLGREAISSGKHYWEVEVNGKTDWDLGVARHSVNRKGKIDYTPNNGFWFLSLRDKNKYAFRSEPYTDFQLNTRPHKIGIFVDYEKGEVSFFNVDAKVHIYSFHDVFTENLYPFFSPCTNKSGKNEMPLIITRVNMTH
ncbi:E3 ubiquitin-protein ligase TRIM39 isoform X1 [Austrofundulus limnaeus]|uniref:E3 ubiquitin-protein ligase TRIM39 isoform X1 n=2 Tax=Austrofundulus limnaeus TaxID=52670 RepID=A0A2I4BE78_AUSLI|nr:PREDICTED: E3 ubiquitin-protein ligase TRIM39-like isoform X1 [Austrofundulus limnaeus]